MYIKNIKLQNYRNFESLDLDLGRQTTVLIGKNGMGKTNMLAAMKQALSFIFRREKGTPQYEFLSSLDKRIRVKSFDPIDARYTITTKGLDYTYPLDVEASMSMHSIDITAVDEPDLHWHIYKDNASKGINESYASESNKFWQHFPNFTNLPVIAFYSAAFPHISARMPEGIKKMLDFATDLPKNHGYYKWDDIMDSNPIWKEYFSIKWWNSRIDPNQKDGIDTVTMDNYQYVTAISKCLIDFSKPLPSDIGADNNDIELNQLTVKKITNADSSIVFDFKNGEQMTFDSLPDGYNRIFSIAFDIANRSYVLNKHCNPEGIVFIDEIDTHLHPSLAQEIMDRLRLTFPKLQFIITTHSPLVLSNFKQDDNNIVYRLSKTQDRKTVFIRLRHTYGIDYNSLLTDSMESPVRNSMLRQLLTSYLYWKDAEDEELMNSTLQEIISLVGEDSRIVNELRR